VVHPSLYAIPNNDSYTFSNFRFILFVARGTDSDGPPAVDLFRFKFFILEDAGGSFTVAQAFSNMVIIDLCVSLLRAAGVEEKHKSIKSNANGAKSFQYSVNPGMTVCVGRHRSATLRKPMEFNGSVENQDFMCKVPGVSKSGRGRLGPFVKVQMKKMT